MAIGTFSGYLSDELEMRARDEKTVVVLQSNYLPWKGYFDLIRKADLLVFYDDTQYTKNDWRNRNLIKTPRGVEWITVPCGPQIHRLIKDVRPVNSRWQRSHWDALLQNYKTAPFFNLFRSFFEDFYLAKTWNNLSELNQHLVKTIASEFLGIKTPVVNSNDFLRSGRKEAGLIYLLKMVGATTYLSGPTGKTFLDPAPFKEAGIKLSWMDYSHYPAYSQSYPPFVHEVSVVDLLYHTGPDAIKYLDNRKSARKSRDTETVS